jgi:formamidopyrimidine-DNA glycosylase
MPELPDVETFRRYVDSTALHKKIILVDIRNTRILNGISRKKLKESLHHRSFVQTRRHGKHLFIQTDDSWWLVLHFGMTGELKYFKSQGEEPSHTRLLLSFSNGYHLAFTNQRKFGRIHFVKDIEQYLRQKHLGKDALEIDCFSFEELLKKRKSKIKSFLMDQKIIAGIGNIYADEILFQAGIHPETQTSQLTKKQIKHLFTTMKKVLEKAVNAQANPDKFPSSYIIPHRKKDATCPKGNEHLKTIKVNGRTTYFCPVHQKKK